MADFSDVVKELKQTNSKLDKMVKDADPDRDASAAETEDKRETESWKDKQLTLLERIAKSVGGLGAGGEAGGKKDGKSGLLSGMMKGMMKSLIPAGMMLALPAILMGSLALLGIGALVVAAVYAAMQAAADGVTAWTETAKGEWGSVDKTSAFIGGLFGGDKEGSLMNALKKGFQGGAMGAAAGFLVGGPPGAIVGAIIGAAIFGLAGWLGGAKIANWVDDTVKDMRSLFDMPELLTEAQKVIYKTEIVQLKKDQTTSKETLETLRKQLKAEGTTYKERLETRKKIRAEEVKLHGIEDDLEDKRSTLAFSELAHKDKALDVQKDKTNAAFRAIFQARRDLKQAENFAYATKRKHGVDSQQYKEAMDAVEDRKLALDGAKDHHKDMKNLDDRMSTERNDLRLKLDREHETFAGNARLSVQGWKDTGKIIAKLVPMLFKRWIFDSGSAGDDTGAGTPMKIFGIDIVSAFKSVKEVLQTKWDKITQGVKSLFKNYIYDPGSGDPGGLGQGSPMRIFGIDFVGAFKSVKEVLQTKWDKIKQVVPIFFKNYIFDPGDGNGVPMRIFGNDIVIPEFDFSFEGILDELPDWLKDPMSIVKKWLKNIEDIALEYMPDWLKKAIGFRSAAEEKMRVSAMIDMGGMGDTSARVHEVDKNLIAAAKKRMKGGRTAADLAKAAGVRVSDGEWAFLGHKSDFRKWMRKNNLDPTPNTGIRDSDITHVAGKFKGAEDWIAQKDKPEVAEEILQAGQRRNAMIDMGGMGDTNIVDASSRVHAPQTNMSVAGTPIVPDNPIIRAVNASN